MTRNGTVFLSALLILATASCTDLAVSKSGDFQGTGGTEVQVKSDIPVPVGFSYYPSKSIVRKTAAMRYLSLFYKGYAEFDQVVEYYRDYGMQKNGWKFGEQSSRGGSVRLSFTKAQERCIIHVSKGLCSVHVEIEVYTYGEK